MAYIAVPLAMTFVIGFRWPMREDDFQNTFIALLASASTSILLWSASS